MKARFLFILLIFTTSVFSQELSDVKNVKMYFVEWGSHYRLARRVENIKQRYVHYFETDIIDFDLLFMDYYELEELLTSNNNFVTIQSGSFT